MFENIRNSILREVPREGTRNVGEYERNVVFQGSGEDRGQSSERIVHADSEVRNRAISENNNGSNRVNVLLNLSGNTLLVNVVLLLTASIGQSGRIEDANLENRKKVILLIDTFKNACTYQHVIFAWKVVNASRVCLTLAARITSFVVVVKDVEVVVISVIAAEDISDEFQE